MSVSYGHVLPFFKTRNDILLDQEAVQWCGNMMYQLSPLIFIKRGGWGFWCLMPLSTIIQLYCGYISGGNQSTG